MALIPKRKQAFPEHASRDDASTSSLPLDEELSLDECAGLVEVQEVSTGIGSVCEDVAVLYANGNTREAEALLERLLADASHAGDELPWTMLLDLYRLTGQRERFETRVIDYATRFERSPPPWQSLSLSSPPQRLNLAPVVSLSGTLSPALGKQLDQILLIGHKNPAVRVDLLGVRGADDAGCEQFLEVIATLRRERVRVSLSNAARLADLLGARIAVGVAEERSVWLLLLELLQHTGEQERFDEIALDYAITFEESPPSWAPVEPVTEEPEGGVAATQASAGQLVFEGEIVGGGSAVIGRLVALAEERQDITVDCSGLRRMDFVSAGTLFNVLSTLRGKGRQVTLYNVNALVLALLHVMGVGQVAKVIPRA